jgi:hypothetical protein
MGTALINQNSIQEEIEVRECLLLFGAVSSFSLLYINLKVCGVYGCETCSLTLRDERRFWRIGC